MKYIQGLFASILLVSATGLVQAGEASDSELFAAVGRPGIELPVALRDSPGKSSRKLQLIPHGAKVLMLDMLVPPGAYRVKYNDQVGYVAYGDLQLGKDASTQLEARTTRTLQSTNGKPLLIRAVYVDEVNSVGGVDVTIDWAPLDSRTIKYIYFAVKPFNSVGDAVNSEIGNRKKEMLKITGPVEGGRKYIDSSWSTVWYNSTVSCIELTGVEVDYIDGSTTTYGKRAKAISDVLAEGMTTSCAYKGP